MQVGDRKQVNRQENGWFKMLILVIAWLLIGSLAKDVWRLRGGFSRISEAEKRLEVEQKRKKDLSLRLEEVSSEAHKEKLIREKLNMQRDGETVVVMPKRADSMFLEGENEGEFKNWEKWWNLID